MSVQEIKDPRTKKVMTLVEGEIEGIYFNELKNVKTYKTNGKSWTPTHAINMKVDGDYVGLGITDKDSISAKDADDNWHDLAKGVEVSIEVTVGEYNGKTQYSALPKNIVVLDASGAVDDKPAPKASSKGGYKKSKDDLPIRLGNAITAATAIAYKSKKTPDIDSVLKVAYALVPQIDELRDRLVEQFPNMDAYSLGARLGQCVIVSSQLYATKSSEIVALAEEMFNKTCDVEAKLRASLSATAEEEEEEKPEEKPKKQTKKTTKKQTKKKAPAPKPEPEPEPEDAKMDADYEFDDDIPW